MANKIKSLRPFFVIGVLLIYFLGAAHAQSRSNVIIVENDWPPYYFGGKEKELPGFAKELLKACVLQAGYNPEFIFFPVNRMYSYLEKGLIDIALFSYRKSREDFVTYGKEPLFVSGYSPVVLKGSNIEIRSLSDFDSLRLGHLAGLKYSPDYLSYVKNRKKAGNLITTTMGEASLRMLLEGIIDIFVDTRDTVLWRAKQMGATDKIKILDFDIKTSQYFVTVSKASPQLKQPKVFLNTIDNCINEMKSSGEYDAISKKYGIQ